MGKAQQILQAKDYLSAADPSAVEIEQMLSELSQLYLERFKAMRSGDQATLQLLTDKINDIKTKLGQI